MSCLAYERVSAFRFLLIWFFRRILMDPLAETTAHPLGQKDRGIAVFVAQFIRSRYGPGPLLPAFILQQVHLNRRIVKAGRLHTEQSNSAAFLPMVAKQLTDSCKDLTINSGWSRQ